MKYRQTQIFIPTTSTKAIKKCNDEELWLSIYNTKLKEYRIKLNSTARRYPHARHTLPKCDYRTIAVLSTVSIHEVKTRIFHIQNAIVKLDELDEMSELDAD